MELDDPTDHTQLLSPETVIPGQTQRFQSEFARPVLAFHVNVRRFVAVEAREEQPIWSRNTLDTWHSAGPSEIGP